MHAHGMGTTQGYELLNRMVDGQAFMLSANDIFYVSAAIMLALIAVVWLARPARGSESAAAASGAH